jgi:LAO/AO transport system kinase
MESFDNQSLIKRIQAGDMRAVSRLISLSENRVPRARDVQSILFKQATPAHVIGVTGSPGAGKSTLVDRLAIEFHNRGERVAILAIDPSSPFSGGAVLGDRIRMNASAERKDIFIRSMATRGALGGLSAATQDAIQVLEAAGFTRIFLETVGVGQAEVDIVRTADTCLVVLVPGMGDSVQAIKAGILEIADLFVINKADRDGADLLHKDIRLMLSLTDQDPASWEIPILKTIATTGEGSTELSQSVAEHHQWLTTSTAGHERRRRIVLDRMRRIAAEELLHTFLERHADDLQTFSQACLNREITPYEAVIKLLQN